MVTPPTFSVILPVYNGARFLSRSVGSVQAQTDEDWELLAIDDGSTDDSLEVLERASADDSRVRVLRSPLSGGPATPRTIGLREARGSIACLIDQDDEWLPEKLWLQRTQFDSSDVGLVYSDCYVADRGEEPFRYSERWGPTAAGDVASALIRNNFVPALTVGLRMSVARAVGGFTPSLAGVDDYEYWLRVAFAGNRFAYIDEPLAVWHLDEHNMSRRNGARQQLRLHSCYVGLARTHPAFAADLRASAERARQRIFTAGLRDAWLKPNRLGSAAGINAAALARARSARECRVALSAMVKGPARRYRSRLLTSAP